MYVVFTDDPKLFGLNTKDFKAAARALELAHITNCDEEHITWILMAELDMSESMVLGYVQAGIAIKQGNAYFTRKA